MLKTQKSLSFSEIAFSTILLSILLYFFPINLNAEYIASFYFKAVLKPFEEQPVLRNTNCALLGIPIWT